MSGTVRYGGRNKSWQFHAAAIAFLTGWTVFLVHSSHNRGGRLIGGLFILFGLLCLAALGQAWRRIALSGSVLRIPKGFNGWVEIPVRDIAGVGLLFCQFPFGTGPGPEGVSSWALAFWRTDGTRALDRAVCVVLPPKSAHKRGQWSSGSVRLKPRFVDEAFVENLLAETDMQRLNSSKPARIALDIYQRVLAAQGTTGPLATQHLQRCDSWANSDSPPLTIAYWSPDGAVGKNRWARDREPPANPPVGWAVNGAQDHSASPEKA